MKTRTIVLVGNPNVGKSLVFNRLTGNYIEVSNFPGTTVTTYKSALGSDWLIDTPGVYGLSRFTEEEKATVKELELADLIINVVDGTHLSRDLFLTLQLIHLGKPMMVVVNMMDEVERQNAQLDTGLLEERLGVPVISVSSLTREGFSVLTSWIETGLPEPPPAISRTHEHLSTLDNLLWQEEDEELLKKTGMRPAPGSRERIYTERRLSADRLADEVFRPGQSPARTSLWLGRFLLTPLGGTLGVSVVLIGGYYLIAIIVANVVVGAFEAFIQGAIIPLTTNVVSLLLPVGSIGYRLLVGQYGLLTAGMTYLLGLLLPLVVAFYFFLAVLEDSGYLPRLATLLDRVFLKVGLNGRAVIPLVLGFGCVTMATVSTRVLSTRRERSIATILLAWTIPCSAQLGVITGLLSGIGWRFAVAYLVVIVGLFVIVGTVLDHTVPGKASPLLLDLPPMRWPDGANVLDKTRIKTAAFLREAGPLFLIGSGLVECATMVGLLPWLDRALAPFMGFWLGLPSQATSAFLLGFIRRDFGTVGLYALGLTPHQILTGAVTLTLFVPCIASTLVIVKERGLGRGTMIWAGSIALALLVGGLTARFGPV